MRNPPKKKHGTKKARRRFTVLKWIVGVGVLALVVYGVSQTSGVPYTDREMGVVDFSSLDPKQKRTALVAANGGRCVCGCGMTLAQCVATDSTCPLRERNIDRVKGMVEQAREPRPAS